MGTVDGGKVKTTYCKQCKCLDPSASSKCEGTCKFKNYKGDGNCDDENNNCGCEYDGGDCCEQSAKGGKVKTQYCKDCKCLDPKLCDGTSNSRTTKETVTATTRTTTAVASTMAVIAVPRLCKVA